MALSGHLTVASEDARKAIYERVLFFSDAVYAIAITLVGLEIIGQFEEVSERIHRQDVIAPEMLEIYAGYLIGFGVLGLYWITHLRVFSFFKSIDDQIVVANLLVLALVVFLPFPTWFWGAELTNTTAIRFYAASLTALGLLYFVLWIVANRRGCVDEDRLKNPPLYYQIRLLVSPFFFMLAFAASYIGWVPAVLIFILTFVLNLSSGFEGAVEHLAGSK